MRGTTILAATLVVALYAISSVVAAPLEYPDELFDLEQVDAVIEQSSGIPGGLGLHFNVPEAFAELNSLLEVQESIGAGSKAKAAISPMEIGRVDFKDEPPILCETICRPVNESEMQSARQEAALGEAEVRDSGAAADAFQGAPMAAAGMSFLELSSKICEAKGGAWVEEGDGKGRCEEYMRASEATTRHDGKALFHICSAEFGKQYVPCSPYQALALSNLYKVPNKKYYRLWPGGRHDQVSSAAMKQQIGNNPATGLDQCPEQQHVGFFHNWDENHVDSWGCLHDELQLNVLCCRRS